MSVGCGAWVVGVGAVVDVGVGVNVSVVVGHGCGCGCGGGCGCGCGYGCRCGCGCRCVGWCGLRFSGVWQRWMLWVWIEQDVGWMVSSRCGRKSSVLMGFSKLLYLAQAVYNDF